MDREEAIGSETSRINYEETVKMVAAELGRQRQKWNIQEHDPSYWFLILSEEVGEVARALCERKPINARQEAVEAMACLAQLIHALGPTEHAASAD